jgi:hypothetical protein
MAAQRHANVSANVDDNVSANVRANVRKNVYANVYDNVHANVRTNVDDNVDDNVSTNVRENVDANVSANVSDNVYANVSTNVDANVCANVYALPTLVCGASWYSLAARADYYSRIGLRFNDYVDVWLKFQRESGAWYLISLADRMIISEAPVLTRLDDQGRLHSETGPAIAWRDCYAQFYWHGQCVPGEWIVCAESVSAADILVESNLEKRRAGCEIIGWDRILTELGAVEIDKHADPEIGTLLDVTLPDSGTERFLRVLEAHSGRQFAYCVPREVNTAQEAQNWIWQCDPGENYQPEARA